MTKPKLRHWVAKVLEHRVPYPQSLTNSHHSFQLCVRVTFVAPKCKVLQQCPFDERGILLYVEHPKLRRHKKLRGPDWQQKRRSAGPRKLQRQRPSKQPKLRRYEKLRRPDGRQKRRNVGPRKLPRQRLEKQPKLKRHEKLRRPDRQQKRRSSGPRKLQRWLLLRQRRLLL